MSDSKALLAVETLTAMSRKVHENAENGFGGMFCIVPPGDGDPQTLIVLDNAQNPAVFWSLLQTRAKMALDEIATKEEQGGAFGSFGRR